MEKRRIGRSELEIVPLVLGGNVFGWSADALTTAAIIDAFLDAGFNAIDTADVYSNWVPGHRGGESETAIGAWLKASGRRGDIMLASKVGAPMPDWGEGLSANYIVKSVEASLRRLQTDYLDLYQAHADDPDTPREETLEAFERLIKAGKVRAIGASHFAAEGLADALGASQARDLPQYCSLQPRYNLYDRVDFGPDLQKVCFEHEVGILAYSALAKGFLTGKVRDESALAGSQYGQMIRQRYLNPRGRGVLEVLDQVSAAHDVAPAAIALAWLIAHPCVVAPIVAVNSVQELQELVGCVNVKLSRAEFDLLSAAGAA